MGLKNFARENKEGEGYEQTNVKVLDSRENQILSQSSLKSEAMRNSNLSQA